MRGVRPGGAAHASCCVGILPVARLTGKSARPCPLGYLLFIALVANFSIAHWRDVPPHKNQGEIEVFIDGLLKAGLR